MLTKYCPICGAELWPFEDDCTWESWYECSQCHREFTNIPFEYDNYDYTIQLDKDDFLELLLKLNEEAHKHTNAKEWLKDWLNMKFVTPEEGILCSEILSALEKTL